jgi:hypothetical protein
MLLFNDPSLQPSMHTARSELGSLIDPESKTGSHGSTFRNFHAFIQPLHNFFKIADGALSKFHNADAFDAAKASYCQALEAHNLLVTPSADVAQDAAGEVDGNSTASENDPANPAEALSAAKLLMSQQLDALVQLVGTLQYLPDPCVIEWSKVTKGDDKLLPQREVEMALITATPEVTQIKQDIWQQTAAAKVRSKIVG